MVRLTFNKISKYLVRLGALTRDWNSCAVTGKLKELGWLILLGECSGQVFDKITEAFFMLVAGLRFLSQ